MKKIINFIKDYAFGFIIGALLFTGISVYAVNTLHSKNLTVDTKNIDGLSGNVTVQAAIEDLYKKEYCPSKYKCYKTHKTPQVGDYIKMTPTSTSFTTDTAKTGYTSTQTINPSELNIWRVIKVNSDGTMEVVSENVSSIAVYFKGQTGYKNLVGYLNELASQYTNTKYVQSTRHMGYNGQTQYLTDTASTVDSTATTAPWTSSTGSSTVESKGGGDTLYTTDTNLVQNALGTLVAKNPSGSASAYWLASRYYLYRSSTVWHYNGRNVYADGIVSSSSLYYYYSGFGAYSYSYRLRPILTLKSGIYTPALGTSYDPFVLS